MKIDGKKPAETSSGWHGVVAIDNGRKELATPKLQARTESATKLMQAREPTSQTLPATDVQPGNMRWVPFHMLCGPQAAGFPDHKNSAEILRPHGFTLDDIGTFHAFDERPGDERIGAQRKINITRHFTTTWLSRLPSHQQQQLEQGLYFLTDLNGRSRHCRAYADFAEFVGAGQTGDLPERVLHVAGPQLHNFLCQTYLYNPALSLFGHAGQRRVEPMPDLRTAYGVARDQHGQVQIRYTARDDGLDRAMLVGMEEHDEHEVSVRTPASIRFHGTLLFSPDGACAIGPVQIHATPMQFMEPAALPVTDSFT